MISKFHHFFFFYFRPWPFIITFLSFNLLSSFLFFLKFGLINFFFFNILLIILCLFFWWIFYRGECNLEGKFSFNLNLGLKNSMILFIFSEICFFLTFFWAYFHFFLRPAIEIGLIWSPILIETFNFMNVPLLNTLILLTSGITVTLSHFFLNRGKKFYSCFNLLLTFFFGLLFRFFQLVEYNNSFFCIRDCNFGSVFFVLTGFHGIHVLVGRFFLFIVLIRFFKFASRKNRCLRFELSSWYWHFVDLIWIFLYFIVYYLND